MSRTHRRRTPPSPTSFPEPPESGPQPALRRIITWVALRPALVFSLAAFAIACTVWPDYGRGWDDGTDEAYAQAVWNFYTTGGRVWEVPPVDGGVMKNYGTFNGLLNSAWHHLWGLPTHLQRPLVHSFFWIATFAPVIWAASALGGRRAGWFAGLALLASPRFFGEAFVNAKDLPLAGGVAWCLWGGVQLVGRDRLTWRHFALGGLTIALALTARPAAVFAFGPLAIASGWLIWRSFVRPKKTPELLRVAGLALLAGAVAVGATCVFWPTILVEGPGAWIRAVLVAKSFTFGYPVLYLGGIHQSTALPWDYPYVYLALTTPLPLLALSATGLFACLAILRRFDSERWPVAASLLTLVAFPFVAFLLLKPNMYDGIRHFLFLIPLLSTAAGFGAAALTRLRPAPAWQLGTTAACTLLLAAGLWPIARMHPYQLTYFNVLAGKPETVHERFETDYWVLSYREAAEWINARQAESREPLHVLVAANGISMACFVPYLDTRVKYSFGIEKFPQRDLPAPFDYYVAMTRYGQSENFPWSPVAHRIESGGILLSIIRRRSLL